MLILNTGGTFNKRYNPINGNLEVPYDNYAVETVLQALHVSDTPLAGAVYKDSLEMNAEDRKMIANIILHSQEKVFIVIHGTDTMHLSAALLDGLLEDQAVIFTGSMVPFSIDPVEARTPRALREKDARPPKDKIREM